MQIKLKVLGGTHEGKEIAIKQDKFLIGRSESCQLRPRVNRSVASTVPWSKKMDAFWFSI